MGYSVFKFGALYLDDKIQPIPQAPKVGGDVLRYNGKSTITIGLSVQDESITWIKPDNLNLLIADRVLLMKVSWEDLNKNGFVNGKEIVIAGQHFRCRLPYVGNEPGVVGNEPGVSNEWDKILDETNEDDILWNWDTMFFFGVEAYSGGRHTVHNTSSRAIRGYFSARFWSHADASNQSVKVGLRPVLVPLSSDDPTPNINLDGMDFQLTSIPGNDTFCPILQPIQEDVFKDIPVGARVWMYTFTENGRPVHMGERVKDVTKLTLTDRYYGDEFLVPWVISNGVAVANQSLLRQSKS